MLLAWKMEKSLLERERWSAAPTPSMPHSAAPVAYVSIRCHQLRATQGGTSSYLRTTQEKISRERLTFFWILFLDCVRSSLTAKK